MDARVEGAKTLSDSYRHCQKDQEVFVAGVQYALDHMLKSLESMTMGSLELEHAVAIGILEKAKRGEPQ